MKVSSRIYIVGAGFAGRAIARELREQEPESEIVAFLDDDREKIGSNWEGIPILGPVAGCIPLLKDSYNDEVIIACPSASRQQIKDIYTLLSKTDIGRIRILPTVSSIVTGDVHLVQARDIDPEDLLGRTPVSINLSETLQNMKGKRVLITGAGGSIGSELCRQLLHAGAERIYLLGHGENSIYRLEKELKRLQDGGVGKDAIIVPVIGELQDRDYIFFILKRLKADFIFHTAAHKHVPMMEKNPVAAVSNNVFGTKNLIDGAEAAGTKRFVLISTDKAVEPSCVYGASKKLAEMLVLEKKERGCDYMVVRFGNVLGARGTIVPLFKEQIISGGPITITHPDMTRFYMTIPEAVSLILKTAGDGLEGGLYMLDMGTPLRIEDMARQMIRFYGYSEDKIGIKYIGLREGEKLEEQLWDKSTEELSPSGEDRVFRVTQKAGHYPPSQEILAKLEPICFFNKEESQTYRNRKQLRNRLTHYFPSVRNSPDEPEY
jgi:FlaA1/EpsC-like NDP-sugar epimerase